jgi:hypothetical protein
MLLLHILTLLTAHTQEVLKEVDALSKIVIRFLQSSA